MSDMRPEGPPQALATIGANVVNTGTTEQVVLRAQVLNAAGVGATFRIRAAATITTLGNPTIRVRVGALGGITDQLAWTSAAATGVLNTPLHCEFIVTVKSLTGVTVEGYLFNGTTVVGRAVGVPTLPAIVGTAPWSITLTSAMSVAAGVLTWTNGIIEKRC